MWVVSEHGQITDPYVSFRGFQQLSILETEHTFFNGGRNDVLENEGSENTDRNELGDHGGSSTPCRPAYEFYTSGLWKIGPVSTSIWRPLPTQFALGETCLYCASCTSTACFHHHLRTSSVSQNYCR